MNTMVKRLQQHPLLLFFTLTLALRALPTTPASLPLLALPISYVPCTIQ